jgi:hypothetical protein
MTVSANPMARSYSQEDIQQILNLAIAQQAHAGEFSHEQLLEIATELGISAAGLQVAEQEWLNQQGELQKRQAFNAHRWHNLQKRFSKYLIVNTFLVLLNLVTGFSFPWSLYIVLFSGLGLGLNVWSIYQTKGEAYERAFRRWQRKHQLRRLVDTWLGKWLNA